MEKKSEEITVEDIEFEDAKDYLLNSDLERAEEAVDCLVRAAERRKEREVLEWARDTAEIEPIIDAINARLEKI